MSDIEDRKAAFVVLAEGYWDADDEDDRQLMWKIAGRVAALRLGNCRDPLPAWPGLTYAQRARVILRQSRTQEAVAS